MKRIGRVDIPQEAFSGGVEGGRGKWIGFLSRTGIYFVAEKAAQAELGRGTLLLELGGGMLRIGTMIVMLACLSITGLAQTNADASASAQPVHVSNEVMLGLVDRKTMRCIPMKR